MLGDDDRWPAWLHEARPRGALLESETEQLLAPRVRCHHVKRAHIRREEVRIGVAIPGGEQLARALRRAVIEHETPAVGLESGTSL